MNSFWKFGAPRRATVVRAVLAVDMEGHDVVALAIDGMFKRHLRESGHGFCEYSEEAAFAPPGPGIWMVEASVRVIVHHSTPSSAEEYDEEWSSEFRGLTSDEWRRLQDGEPMWDPEDDTGDMVCPCCGGGVEFGSHDQVFMCEQGNGWWSFDPPSDEDEAVKLDGSAKVDGET